MKKQSNLILLFLLIVLLFGFSASAQEGPLDCCILPKEVIIDGNKYQEGDTVGREEVCSLTEEAVHHVTKKWALICLVSSIKLITDWIFTFLMIFVSVMVMLGAYEIATAGGSPDKFKKGKDYILYALIGLAISAFSKGVPSLIKALLGI